MEANEALASALREAGLTQAELAEAVNAYLRSLGREGTVSDRTVRHWLTGKTRWPHPRQREALQAVFGCPVEDLGFATPAARRTTSSSPEDDPVRRRNFITATTGATAAAVPLVAARPHAVGTTDVLRLRSGLDALTALDDTRGGHEALERAALSGASQALDMQTHAASQRVRQRLFGVAADYTATAAWSALDGRLPERTEAHLNRALYLAGMAKDPAIEMRVWNFFAMLAHQRHNYRQAVDSAHAAQATAITRRDPLHASLAHARAAVCHAHTDDRQGALRSLGHAREALDKADLNAPRPRWLDFYGPAELNALASVTHDRIGQPSEAEAASHRALSAIPERFRRNRALATAQLAFAQLHQHDTEQACDTAGQVFALMDGAPIPGRMRSLLGDFHRDLITTAPDAPGTREWTERHRDEWSRTR
ncbi:helix-turn-helix transcriptional regulator [Streptomyces sp. HNM0575]|uniref:helix-turn-helix transcriptional regulator n=1 Tax=Streptomyces sp. HNM0575 TaxID=2716338 RepID=UPI00145E6E4F|nr:helix-turn-helix transcriptional regulator [Streptomyces sp. HNM0575]